MNEASRKLRQAAANLSKEQPSEKCFCGWYGFRSTLCPYLAMDISVPCGQTISKETNRPIFCMKTAPKITLPEHVVPQRCPDCRFNKSVSLIP
jgi:hypothetical protein